MRYIATIHETIQETPDVVTLRFSVADDTYPLHTPGQYITVHNDKLGVPAGKAYSLSSTPSDPWLSITVKDIGPYSHYLYTRQSGDEIEVSQPYGDLFEDTGEPLVLIAAGVGISPLWSILQSVLTQDSSRNITLIYSNKTQQDIVFAQHIDSLSHDNLTVRHYLTQESAPGMQQGRICLASLADLPTQDTQYVLCGSESFVRDIYRHVTTHGVDPSCIATEIFFEQAGR